MKAKLKGIKIGTKTTTITLEHLNLSKAGKWDIAFLKDELKAIAILLGGYNALSNNVTIETYEALKARFDSIIDELQIKV